MPTPRNDRIRIRLLANNTRKRDALEHLLLVLIIRIRISISPIPTRHRPAPGLLPLAHILPLAIQLPALLVVLSGMQELAAVAEAAEARLLVVFADVGGEVGDGDGTDVGGGFDGADGLGGRVGVFLDEGLVAGCAVVGAVASGGRSASGAEELTVAEGGGGDGGGGGGFVEPVGLFSCVVGRGDGSSQVGRDAGRGEVGSGGFGGGSRRGGYASGLFASFDAVTGGFVFGGGVVG